MKNVKTVICAFSAVCVISVLLAGCGGQNVEKSYDAKSEFELVKAHYKFDAALREGNSLQFSFLQREGTVPIQFSMSANGFDSATAPQSLLEVSFEMDGKRYAQKGFSAEPLNGGDYKSKFVFERIALDGAKPMPKKITLTYLEKESVGIDISKIDISSAKTPEASKSPEIPETAQLGEYTLKVDKIARTTAAIRQSRFRERALAEL
jgi:hypothetical protein